ncbi:winged helix-turn-helix transcriptional regulator, partial [Pseudomonas aeruginosa]
MINVAILSAIRRWHFRDGASIREIARRSGLSRNTVRKYLQSKVVEPQYPARDSVGKLSPFEPKLRIPRHSDTQPTLIRTPVPRSFGQA